MKSKKMAVGGLAKAAQMSGRTMPATGAGATASPGSAGLAKAAEMSGRTMPATGRRMATGGMAKKGYAAGGAVKKGGAGGGKVRGAGAAIKGTRPAKMM